MKISKRFKYKNTIGQYTFIKERIDHYQNSYFPIPFKELLKSYATDDVLSFLEQKQSVEFIKSNEAKNGSN